MTARTKTAWSMNKRHKSLKSGSSQPKSSIMSNLSSYISISWVFCLRIHSFLVLAFLEYFGIPRFIFGILAFLECFGISWVFWHFLNVLVFVGYFVFLGYFGISWVFWNFAIYWIRSNSGRFLVWRHCRQRQVGGNPIWIRQRESRWTHLDQNRHQYYLVFKILVFHWQMAFNSKLLGWSLAAWEHVVLDSFQFEAQDAS